MTTAQQHTNAHFIDATYTGNLELMQSLIEAGADINTICESTPLHIAAAVGDINLIQWLIHRGAIVTSRDQSDNTPLHLAIRANNPAAVKTLLDHSADVNAANRHGATPLHWAAADNQLNTVALLLDKGASITAVDRWKHTPSQIAEACGNTDLVAMLTRSPTTQRRFTQRVSARKTRQHTADR
jgi:ankyrin repeat protein